MHGLKTDADVVIAGGGLAGATLALDLAQRGHRVVVVDKAVFPRDKPCGEGLLPAGVDVLAELGLGDVLAACGAQPFRGILYACHGVTARGDFEDGALGQGVRRRALDAAVRERAERAGVSFVSDHVDSLTQDDAGATLSLGSGKRVRGAFVVGADGPRSVVRHALGLDGGAPRRPRYALRQHFRARGPLPDRVEVHVQSGHELYVTPVADGVVGVAALCEKETMEGGSGSPTARLRALLDACAPLRDRVDVDHEESQGLACGPLRVRSRGVWRGRAVLVGDAAGYVDAITGEGMSLALKTARRAAQALHAVLGGAVVGAEFDAYAKDRAGLFRDHAWLTFGLVELARRPFFARRAVARLRHEPALFSRLLAVNNGTRSLLSLSLSDALKLAVGKAPTPLLLAPAAP